MTGAKLILAAALFLLYAGCANRDFVRYAGGPLVGFKFFLFLSVKGQGFQANGDAAIVPGDSFKFRVYDNLLGSELFDFVSHADGMNEIVNHSEKLVVRKRDAAMALVLTCYFYRFFDLAPDAGLVQFPTNIGGMAVSSVDWFSARLDGLTLAYSTNTVRVFVQKRRADLTPQTIRIESGGDYFVFDIVSFTGLDFLSQARDYKVVDVSDQSQATFLEWLGEAYGKE